MKTNKTIFEICCEEFSRAGMFPTKNECRMVGRHAVARYRKVYGKSPARVYEEQPKFRGKVYAYPPPLWQYIQDHAFGMVKARAKSLRKAGKKPRVWPPAPRYVPGLK